MCETLHITVYFTGLTHGQQQCSYIYIGCLYIATIDITHIVYDNHYAKVTGMPCSAVYTGVG